MQNISIITLFINQHDYVLYWHVSRVHLMSKVYGLYSLSCPSNLCFFCVFVFYLCVFVGHRVVPHSQFTSLHLKDCNFELSSQPCWIAKKTLSNDIDIKLNVSPHSVSRSMTSPSRFWVTEKSHVEKSFNFFLVPFDSLIKSQKILSNNV